MKPTLLAHLIGELDTAVTELLTHYSSLPPEEAKKLEAMANVSYNYSKELLAFQKFILPTLGENSCLPDSTTQDIYFPHGSELSSNESALPSSVNE